jgi:hypothetical protein
MTMMNGDIGEEEEIMTPDEGYKRWRWKKMMRMQVWRMDDAFDDNDDENDDGV